MGNYTYFGTSPMGLRNGIDWFAIPLCGAVGVLAGGLFSRVVVAMARGFSNPMGRANKRYPLGFAVICGFRGRDLRHCVGRDDLRYRLFAGQSGA